MSLRCLRPLKNVPAGLAVTTLALGFGTTMAAASGVAPDRLILTASGSTLNTASGGGQGAVTWLHAFTADALAGVGGEYDTIGNARWTLGTLTSAVSGGPPANRWTVAADARIGGGDIGPRRFNYDVEAVGVRDSVSPIVSLQLETRQFDIYTTHGNLPKAAISLFLASHWLLGAAYAHSVGGNLGTVFASARLDHLGGAVSWFVGGAKGHVAPAVLNIQTGAMGPVPRYWDGYAGFTRTLTRTQWTISADYLDLLLGTRRLTLTVTCSLLSSQTQ
jgi:hypothetical protein